MLSLALVWPDRESYEKGFKPLGLGVLIKEGKGLESVKLLYPYKADLPSSRYAAAGEDLLRPKLDYFLKTVPQRYIARFGYAVDKKGNLKYLSDKFGFEPLINPLSLWGVLLADGIEELFPPSEVQDIPLHSAARLSASYFTWCFKSDLALWLKDNPYRLELAEKTRGALYLLYTNALLWWGYLDDDGKEIFPPKGFEVPLKECRDFFADSKRPFGDFLFFQEVALWRQLERTNAAAKGELIRLLLSLSEREKKKTEEKRKKKKKG